MQRALLVACVAAFLTSASSFALLVLQPQVAEQNVRSALVFMLKRKMRERFGRELQDAEVAQAVERDLRTTIKGIEARLASTWPEIEALVFSYLCEFCLPPMELASATRARMQAKLAGLDAGITKVRSWAESHYSDGVRELIGELRIFSGTNAALLLLALIGLARGDSHRVVRTLACLLLVATVAGSYFYLANQNWLLTLVLSDYVGWGYLAWVSVLFAVLIDCVFLRARITNALVNGVLSAFTPVG